MIQDISGEEFRSSTIETWKASYNHYAKIFSLISRENETLTYSSCSYSTSVCTDHMMSREDAKLMFICNGRVHDTCTQ